MVEPFYSVVSPEQEELEAKRAELEYLSELLAERELGIATLQSALHHFKQRYYRQVGVRYVALDEVQAQIAELLAHQHPTDLTVQAGAERARETAAATAIEYEHVFQGPDGETEEEPFAPSDDMKKVYRQIALNIHPDKATDETTCALRTKLMGQANSAYSSGDIEALRRILREWEFSPEVVAGNGTAADLVRTIRSLAQVKARLEFIDAEITTLKDTDAFKLMQEAESLTQVGRDLLVELTQRIEEDLQTAREHLTRLREQGTHDA